MRFEALADRYDVFDSGCTCGQVLDHLSVCVAFVRNPEGSGSLFPDAEMRRCRESVLDGVDPVSGSALDEVGWRAEVQRSDEGFVKSMLVAAQYDGLDEDRDLRVASGAQATTTWRRVTARRAADAAQWHQALLSAAPEGLVPSWDERAAWRARSVAGALSQTHENVVRGANLRTLSPADVLRVGDEVVVLRMPRHMAADHGDPRPALIRPLALRKCLARWLHVVAVLYPASMVHPKEATVVVIARAHRDRPNERPPTRFVRVEQLPATSARLRRLASELVDGAPAGSVKGTISEQVWPTERMTAGLWPAVCVESAELADIGRRLGSGSLFAVEPLRSRGSFWPADSHVRSMARQAERGMVEICTPAGKEVRDGPRSGTRTRSAVSGASQNPDWRLQLNTGIRVGDSQLAAVAPLTDRTALASSPHDTRSAPVGAAPSWDRAMSMWFNSTLGLLSVLGAAVPRSGEEWSVDQLWLRQTPVPTLARRRQVALAAAHDRLEFGALKPFAQAPDDPMRIEIDDAVCEATGCDPKVVERARSLLAEEPMMNHRLRDPAPVDDPRRGEEAAADAVLREYRLAQIPDGPRNPNPDRRVGDWTSWSAAGVLLLLLPASIASSLMLLLPLGLVWPQIYWAVAVYFALGLLILIPGVEDLLWGVIFSDSREPRPHERARLQPAWDKVLERSGRTDGARYRLRIIETDEINAMAGGGHQVFVTTAALEVMPDDYLPGVLAHELGHHVGLHPVALGLELWFLRPVVWAHTVAIMLHNMCAAITAATIGTGILGIVIGLVTLAIRALAWALHAVTWIAIATLRLVGRQAEYRADRYAAQIGFARELSAFLETPTGYHPHDGESERRSLTEIITSTHPPSAERIRRLRPYVR